MKRARYSYYPGPVGWPSMIIALGWVGLWMVWPMYYGGSEGSSMPAPRVATIRLDDQQARLHMKPDLFALPSAVGFMLRGSPDEVIEPGHARRSSRSRMLARQDAASATQGHVASLRDDGFPGSRDYRPHCSADPVFSRQSGAAMHLAVRFCANLEKHGFHVPGISEAVEDLSDKPWQVAVFVEVGANGRTEHVFLDSACESDEINTAVIRKMYAGRLRTQGTACAGRVVVSFARQ